MAESVYLGLTLQQHWCKQRLEFGWANAVRYYTLHLLRHYKNMIKALYNFFLLLYFPGEVLIHINTFHKQKTGKMKLKYSEQVIFSPENACNFFQGYLFMIHKCKQYASRLAKMCVSFSWEYMFWIWIYYSSLPRRTLATVHCQWTQASCIRWFFQHNTTLDINKHRCTH